MFQRDYLQLGLDYHQMGWLQLELRRGLKQAWAAQKVMDCLLLDHQMVLTVAAENRHQMASTVAGSLLRTALFFVEIHYQKGLLVAGTHQQMVSSAEFAVSQN